MGPKVKPEMDAKAAQDALDEKKATRRGSKKGKKKEEPPPPTPVDFSDLVFSTRSFLFIKLLAATHLPKRKYDLEIHLSHPKNNMQRIEHCHYSTNLCIELKDYELNETKPVFCMIIEQDNIEDMNLFSDNPLQIKLYEHVKPKPRVPRRRYTYLEEGEEETDEGVAFDDEVLMVESEVKRVSESNDLKPATRVSNYDKETQTFIDDFVENFVEEELEEECLILLSIGYIDLLPFFCKKRVSMEMSAFLYPLVSDDKGIPLSTTKTTWQIFTTVPLLRNITFCNMIFISFESIFNAKPEITDDPEDLTVSLYFESKLPNENNEFTKTLICTYDIFYNCIIAEQNTNIKWQTLKNINNMYNLGIYSNCKLSLHKIFKNLLWSDGTTFNFDLINTENEDALICNSVHRYMISSDLSQILEEAIAFNQQHILIEIYHQNLPEEILLSGILDLSIFCFPNVNAIRFAIDLKSPADLKIPKAKQGNLDKDKKSGGATDKRKSDEKQPENPTFCIVNICLLTPISENVIDMSKMNENAFTMDNLKRCDPIVIRPALASPEKVIEDNYQLFDEFILEITNHLIKNNVQNKDKVKTYLCCQLSNLINCVMKLIACDFNVRIPTTTNVEFNNMLTVVFKELEQRIYNKVQNFDPMDPSRSSTVETQMKIVELSNIMKLVEEVGDHKLSYLLFDKIKAEMSTVIALNYYMFIYRIEYEWFEQAKEYLLKSAQDKYYSGEYFSDFAEMYIKYVEDLSQEETYNEAIGKLIDNIKIFTLKYPRDMDAWILLYCIFKKSNYLPGMHYARWKFENLYTKERRVIPPMPISRWNLYLDYDVTLKTIKGQQFWKTFRVFVNFGLYKFSEFVFDEIAKECAEVERYLITTTIKILLQQVPPKAQTKTFSVDKMPNGNILKAFLAQINGSFEYAKNNLDAGCRQYVRIMDIKLESIYNYQLGLLRYGAKKYEDGLYQAAFDCFYLVNEQRSEFFVQYNLGRTLYRLNRFEEAIRSFARTTIFEFHMPDMWAWLALNNLKIGNNYNVLACWRYAKFDSEVVICDEVIEELNRIPHDDVDLYVNNVVFRH